MTRQTQHIVSAGFFLLSRVLRWGLSEKSGGSKPENGLFCLKRGGKWCKMEVPSAEGIFSYIPRQVRLQMFTGTYQNSIDSKNRMIIPSRYRDQLGGHCMLTRGFDRCLYIYAMDDYEILVNKIRKLPQSDRDVRKFIREFFSNTEECHLDAQGRILIPQHLRDYAGISKNLVTKGALDKIEIWSTEVLADPEGENMMDNEEFVRKLDMYDL